MRQKLMDFMRGRNGTDQLSMCMMWAACILVFIDMFVWDGHSPFSREKHAPPNARPCACRCFDQFS